MECLNGTFLGTDPWQVLAHLVIDKAVLVCLLTEEPIQSVTTPFYDDTLVVCAKFVCFVLETDSTVEGPSESRVRCHGHLFL